MEERDWNKNLQEPAAAGREAFWAGRPVWANPCVGAVARAWKAGWLQGQAELACRAGDGALTTSASEQQRLLQRHRPDDIAPVLGQQSQRSRPRVLRAASQGTTYSTTTRATGPR